jgi:regulation of enolase protein 1 (concanavalin A-like superfamily)
MHRIAILLLCTLLAVAGGLAAPAPLPRSPWATGWEKPVDPVGDCRFDRKGDKLTITVPGDGHALEEHTAPCLLREVVGDFLVEVRVGGNFRPKDPKGYGGWRQAGLLLAGKLKFTAGQFAYDLSDSGKIPLVWLPRFTIVDKRHPAGHLPVWLRLERRGNVVRLAFAPDGKTWQALQDPLRIDLPPRVKVGVVAEARAEATFTAVFDKFKLTSLAGKTR